MRLTHYFIVTFGFLILGGCVSNTYVTDPQIERDWAIGRLSERPPEFLRASLVMGLRLGDSTAEFIEVMKRYNGRFNLSTGITDGNFFGQLEKLEEDALSVQEIVSHFSQETSAPRGSFRASTNSPQLSVVAMACWDQLYELSVSLYASEGFPDAETEWLELFPSDRFVFPVEGTISTPFAEGEKTAAFGKRSDSSSSYWSMSEVGERKASNTKGFWVVQRRFSDPSLCGDASLASRLGLSWNYQKGLQ